MSEPAATSSAALDRLIGGKYRVVRKIASGGMGSVHEAVHVRTQGHVALKILSDDAKRDESSRSRFAREARASGQLRSRHVARVLDVDALEDGTPYLVMELLQGRDLSREVKASGPLPVADAAAILVQVAAGVAEAHEAGIVHRDLKPGNVFIAEEGAQRIAKVLDFGISKVPDADTEELTRTFATVGTPGYMSPEQIRSPRDVDSSTDVWSFGVMLYRVLAGKMPFSGNSSSIAVSICHDIPPPLGEARNDIPEPLLALIERMLDKDRHRRPTIREAASVLLDHVGGSSFESIAREAYAELSGLPPEPPREVRLNTPATVHGLPAVAAPPAPAIVLVPKKRSPVPFIVAALVIVCVAVIFVVRTRSNASHDQAAAPSVSIPPPKIAAVAVSATTSAPVTASISASPPEQSVKAPIKPAPTVAKPKPSNGTDSSNIPARL